MFLFLYLVRFYLEIIRQEQKTVTLLMNGSNILSFLQSCETLTQAIC